MQTKRSFVRILRGAAALSVVASVAVSSAEVAAAATTGNAQPAAATKIRYKASILAPSPASDFSFTGGGDGWDLAFSPTQFFNAYHHDGNFNIDCHVKSTGDQCVGFPKAVFDNANTNFTTGGKPGLYYDDATGNLYAYSVRGDNHAGVLCVDPRTTSKYCGFTDYGMTTDGQFGISNGVPVGTKYYAFVYSNGRDGNAVSPNNRLLCFDLAAHAACATPAYPVAVPTIGTGSPYPGITAIGTRVLINLSNSWGQMTCFDTTTMATCSGSWPLTGLSWNNGVGPFPVLDSSGTPIGVCHQGTTQCFDFTGTAITAPNNIGQIPIGTVWQGSSMVVGTRVYQPYGDYNRVYCYDYAAGDLCPNYPVELGNRGVGYLYTVAWDKQSPSCIWVSADNGSHKITNFDAMTGGKCGAAGATIAEGDILAPRLACTDVTWDGLYLSDPAGGTFEGGSVTIKNPDGTVTGLPVQNFGADGVVDFSSISSQIPDGPRFTIELTNPEGVKALTVEFDWLGQGLSTCLMAPSAPGPSISGDLGTRIVHVNWTAPMRDGIARNPQDVRGSNVASYVATVTGPNGEKYTCKTTGLSCDVKARKTLRSGQHFEASVVAVSTAGKSEPGTASVDLNGAPAAPVLKSVSPGLGSAELSFYSTIDRGGAWECCYYQYQVREKGDSQWGSIPDGWVWQGDTNVPMSIVAGNLDPSITYEVRVVERFYMGGNDWEFRYSNALEVNSISSSISVPSVSGLLTSGTVSATAKQGAPQELPVTAYQISLLDAGSNVIDSCTAEDPVPGTPVAVGTCMLATGEATGPFTLSATADNGVLTSEPGTADVTAATVDTVLKSGKVGESLRLKVAPKNARLVAGVLPPGTSLTSRGFLVGTPTQASRFDTRYTFRVTGGGQTATYALAVNPASVELTAPAAVLLVVGEELKPWMSFGVADPAAPELRYYLCSGLGMPNGVALGDDGILRGAPTEAGSFTFEVCAVDAATGESYRGSIAYTMTVGTVDGSGRFTMPDLKWLFRGDASPGFVASGSGGNGGAGGVGGNGGRAGLLNLTTDTPNVGGSAILPVPLSVTDFTVSATLDLGQGGDGIALALVDPTVKDLLGTAGGQLGLNGLVGAAVTWDTHQNVKNGDPSNNFMGIATQRAEGRFTYAATKVLEKAGATELRGLHDISAHFEQVGDQWHVTSVLDGNITLEADIPGSAINPTSLLVFTSSNGTRQGAHSASNVAITTPTNTAVCQVRNTASPFKAYGSLQDAADAASQGDTLAVSGTCGNLSTLKDLTIGGIGDNASIHGSIEVGNFANVTLKSLHVSNPDGIAISQFTGSMELDNVVVSNSKLGIYANGQVSINDSQIVDNTNVGTYDCAGLGIGNGTVYLNNSLVSRNESTGSNDAAAGGICVSYGSLYSNGSIISHNVQHEGYGGGGITNFSGWVQLRGTTMAYNHADHDGGAYFAVSGWGDISTNDGSQMNRFYKNSSGGTGGAIFTRFAGLYVCGRNDAPTFVGNVDNVGFTGFVSNYRGGLVSTGSNDLSLWWNQYTGPAGIDQMWYWCD